MPPRRDIYSSFSDPNSFLGQPFIPRVASAMASGAGSIGRAEDQFRTNVTSAAQRGISNLGRLATTIGGAITFPIRAAQEALGGTPLIAGSALGRTPQAEAPSPSVPAFPSGTGGIYSPVVPVAPTIPTTPEVAQPTRFSNPRPATADDLDAFYRRGAYAPQPTPQVAQPAQRTTIQTPYGTISATAEQVANMNRPRTVDQQSSRSPAEQQDILAQIRQNAASLNRERTQWVEQEIAAGRELARQRRKAGARNYGSDRFGRTPKIWAENQAREDTKIARPSIVTGNISDGRPQSNQGVRIVDGPKPVPMPITVVSPDGQTIKRTTSDNLGMSAGLGGMGLGGMFDLPNTQDLLGRRYGGPSSPFSFL